MKWKPLFIFFMIGLSMNSALSAETTGENQKKRKISMYFMAGGGGYETDLGVLPTTALYPVLIGRSASNATLYDLSLLEAFAPVRTESSEGVLRLGVDFQFTDSGHFRGNAGFSHASGTETCISNCGDFQRLFILDSLLNHAASSSRISPFLTFILLGGDFNTLLSTPELSYSYSTLDFGVSGYLFPDELWNPYIGVEFGLGVCDVDGTSGVMCTILRGGVKAGVEINLTDRFYLFMQAEHYAYRFTFTASASDTGGGSETVSASTPVFATTNAMFGAGFRF